MKLVSILCCITLALLRTASPAGIDAEQLVEKLKALPYWTSDRDLGASDVEAYRKFAALFQTAAESARLEAMNAFMDYAKENSRNDKRTGLTWTKLQLALRVAFAVEKRKGVLPMNGMVGSPRDDVLWPLAVDEKGNLRFVARFWGSMGVYHPEIDYDRFKRHFGWRKLK